MHFLHVLGKLSHREIQVYCLFLYVWKQCDLAVLLNSVS